MNENVEEILTQSNFSPFPGEIAGQAKRGMAVDRIYELQESDKGIATGNNRVSVYLAGDAAFFIGQNNHGTAYGGSQFDLHTAIRRLLDDASYVLTYYDSEAISDEQAETVGIDIE